MQPIKSAISLWNFNPEEKNQFPESFLNANKKFIESFKVITPSDIEGCLDEFPKLRDIWDRISHWVVKTDLARLLYVYKYGGFYFDSDCVIIKNFPTDDDEKLVLVEQVLLYSTQYLGPRECKDYCRRQRIANYAFGANKIKHSFFKHCIEECLKRLEEVNYTVKTAQDVSWVCGSDVVTSIYHTTKYPCFLLKGYMYVKHDSWRKFN